MVYVSNIKKHEGSTNNTFILWKKVGKFDCDEGAQVHKDELELEWNAKKVRN